MSEERDRAAVTQSNEAFYAAFRARDIDAMEALWAKNCEVAIIHPGWPSLHTLDAVLDSLDQIFEGDGSPEIHCEAARAVVLGDSAYVVCTEKLADGDLVASNLFVREDGEWRMVLHQAGPAPLQAMGPSGTAGEFIH